MQSENHAKTYLHFHTGTQILICGIMHVSWVLQILVGSHRVGRIDHKKVGDQVGADLERLKHVQQFCSLLHVEVCVSRQLYTPSENQKLTLITQLYTDLSFVKVHMLQLACDQMPMFTTGSSR